MHFGFSYIGFLFLCMLIIPNLLWTKNQPKDYGKYVVNENKILLAAVVVMLFYEIWWIRYFVSNKTMNDFYSDFLGIPVAGATLPVMAFLLLSVYGRNFFLLFAVAILGVGHIGIHLMHKKEISGEILQ